MATRLCVSAVVFLFHCVSFSHHYLQQVVLNCIKERRNEQEECSTPLDKHFMDNNLLISHDRHFFVYLDSSNGSLLHTIEEDAANHFQTLGQNNRRGGNISIRDKLLLTTTWWHSRYGYSAWPSLALWSNMSEIPAGAFWSSGVSSELYI